MLGLPFLILAIVIAIMFILFALFTIIASIVGGAATAAFVRSRTVRRLLLIIFGILSLIGLLPVLPLIMLISGVDVENITIVQRIILTCISTLSIVGIRFAKPVGSRRGREVLTIAFSTVLSISVLAFISSIL